MTITSFCSWSGGKDSCLALYRAINEGCEVKRLLTMMCDDREGSRSHGLPPALVEAQSRALGIPLVTRRASWEAYEEQFLDALAQLRGEGIIHGVFGDIDMQDHLDWVAGTCRRAGMTFTEPLWQNERARVVREFADAGFRAVIVSCDAAKVGPSYLGRDLTSALAEELSSKGVDAAGENGEYHTFVYDGPLFSERVDFTPKGITGREGYLFLELA